MIYIVDGWKEEGRGLVNSLHFPLIWISMDSSSCIMKYRNTIHEKYYPDQPGQTHVNSMQLLYTLISGDPIWENRA